jgi:hypothetical protein
MPSSRMINDSRCCRRARVSGSNIVSGEFGLLSSPESVILARLLVMLYWFEILRSELPMSLSGCPGLGKHCALSLPPWHAPLHIDIIYRVVFILATIEFCFSFEILLLETMSCTIVIKPIRSKR